MGQKTHPIGFRVGVYKDWNSRWFAKKDYAKLLHEDIYIRRHVKKKLYHGCIAKIDIERTLDQVRVKIYASRPGIIIGKKGAEVDVLRVTLQKLTKKQVHIDVIEVKDPEVNAQLISESIASQLERRVAYRRAMKKAINAALHLGAKGIKIRCGGRLAGGEIARQEWYLEGRLPLHTLRADIDFGRAEALTAYGLIGVKVWVFKGEILGPERQMSAALKSLIERKVKPTVKAPRPAFKPRPGMGRGGKDFGGGQFSRRPVTTSGSSSRGASVAPVVAPAVKPAAVVATPEST